MCDNKKHKYHKTEAQISLGKNATWNTDLLAKQEKCDVRAYGIAVCSYSGHVKILCY
jgi:hypothetical protein